MWRQERVGRLYEKIKLNGEDIAVTRRIIASSHPSDYIVMTAREEKYLSELFCINQRGFQEVPSDIFFSKTVPMMDCLIYCPETHSNYRVIVNERYKESIDIALRSGGKTAVCVAIIVTNWRSTDQVSFFFPVFVWPGNDKAYFTWAGPTRERDEPEYEKHFGECYSILRGNAGDIMSFWYCIQLALLHPVIKEVFSKPRIIKLEESCGGGERRRKRSAKYIKRHVITVDKIDAVINEESSRTINRKCLAWYVIGHWRHYKDGREIFIQPYWKGALRELRRNASGDDRERIIAKPTQ